MTITRIAEQAPGQPPSGMEVTEVAYPLLEPAGAPMTAGESWSAERGVTRYRGWDWSFVNQHGFVYQALAIHRCVAAGLPQCPQFSKAESLHVMGVLDAITEQQGSSQATVHGAPVA